jgi:hypothetical protein
MTVVGDSPLPTDPGWYPDPYDGNQQRWFDGSRWTLHAVADWEWDPDQVVDRNWAADSPEQLRRQEWDAQFPAKGTISYQSALPLFDRKSGLFVHRQRPWLNAIGLLFALAISGVITIAAAVHTATGPQYWGAWVAITTFLIGYSIVVALWTIRKWPRPRRSNEEFETSSRRHRTSRT